MHFCIYKEISDVGFTALRRMMRKWTQARVLADFSNECSLPVLKTQFRVAAPRVTNRCGRFWGLLPVFSSDTLRFEPQG